MARPRDLCRAAGASGFDEAVAWARGAVETTKSATPTDVFHTIDEIAAGWIAARSGR